MSVWRAFFLAMLCLSVGVVGYVSCNGGGGGSGESDDSEDDDDDNDDAPILGPPHMGWKNPDCAACHSLPEEDHSQTDPPQCAACHGANGACEPNGPQSGHQSHSQPDDCLSCHPGQHGFAANGDCTSCHYAFAGTDECGAGDTDSGVDTLVDNCFNWPAEEFSPSNNVGGLSTGVSEGQQLVDFTLMDVDGTEHTLSNLLTTKPVLLVFGSYT
ncbi:MAG: hypothetical protein JRF63_06750 [Deltaproteobacteria bacterium]|nr:hypothetical protein [Deltaproteobacteria bacterium]